MFTHHALQSLSFKIPQETFRMTVYQYCADFSYLRQFFYKWNIFCIHGLLWLKSQWVKLFFLEPRYWVTELWPCRWKRCLRLVQNHHSKKASVTRIHIQHIDLQLNNTFPTVSTESAGLHTVWSQSRRQGTTCNAKTLQKNKSLWFQWLLHHICPNYTTRLHKTCIWKKERTKKKKILIPARRSVQL